MYCGPWFLKIIFTLPSHTHETKLFLLSKIVIRTGAQTLVSPFSFSLVLTTSKKKLNWFRSFDSVLFQSLFFLSTAFFIDSLCRHLDNLKPRAKYFAGAKCRRFLVMGYCSRCAATVFAQISTSRLGSFEARIPDEGWQTMMINLTKLSGTGVSTQSL